MEREDILKLKREEKLVRVVLNNSFSYLGRFEWISDVNQKGDCLIYFFDDKFGARVRFNLNNISSIEEKGSDKKLLWEKYLKTKELAYMFPWST